MKGEKAWPASRRQLRRLTQLGVAHVAQLTQHGATRLINAAVAALRLGRGVRLPPLS